MKPKEYAAEVMRRMINEEYDAYNLGSLVYMLHSGIYIEGDTVYTIFENQPEYSVEEFKKKYSINGSNAIVVAYFNKVSEEFNKLIKEFLKDDVVEMDLAITIVIYLREYDIEYTGTYKTAKEIINKFDIFDNCDSAMIELTNLAYQYDAIAKQYREIDPKRFLDDIADFVVKYFKGYYDE